MLTGLAGAGALAALPARAQLPGWIMDKAPAAPPVDYLSVARAQLARESRHIAQTDRVGIVDFGLPSSRPPRSEAPISELQSSMRTSYAVFCFKKKNYCYL